MKQYYMLVQEFHPGHIPLEEYLDQQGISYRIGADFVEELREFGYSGVVHGSLVGTLVHTYKVLIEEHELSAIKLSVDGVDVIKNRRGVILQNKIRRCFSWILD